MKTILSLFPLLMVTACVTAPSNFDRGLSNFKDGNLEAAYRFLEEPTASQKITVQELFKNRPEILRAGAKTFTEDALKESIKTYGRSESFKIEHKRLELFRGYADFDLLETAELAFAKEFGAELSSHFKEVAERARVAKLPEAEQAQYWADRYKKWEESVTIYGRVMGAQLIDESRSGNTTGSQIGALVAQAAYIDTRNIFNYSAMGQLQSGLMGGVLGSLANKSPVTAFRKVYFLKIGAEVKRLDIVDTSQILYPIGVCIYYREPFAMNIASDDKCVPVNGSFVK